LKVAFETKKKNTSLLGQFPSSKAVWPLEKWWTLRTLPNEQHIWIYGPSNGTCSKSRNMTIYNASNMLEIWFVSVSSFPACLVRRRRIVSACASTIKTGLKETQNSFQG
jgi:hypothetical protein